MASRPRRSLPLRILKWIGLGLLAFILFSVLWVLAYRFVNPPITLTQAGDALWGNGLSREWVPIERINRNMVRAAIAGEDSKFCSHNGFDTQAIEAAMRRNAAGGHVLRGGSTISQQTAKNVFLWQGGGYLPQGAGGLVHFADRESLGQEADHGGLSQRRRDRHRHLWRRSRDAALLSSRRRRRFRPQEAARIAAIFPLPKRREVIDPAGFTRRYGNLIFRRIGVVAQRPARFLRLTLPSPGSGRGTAGRRPAG